MQPHYTSVLTCSPVWGTRLRAGSLQFGGSERGCCLSVLYSGSAVFVEAQPGCSCTQLCIHLYNAVHSGWLHLPDKNSRPGS